jgi:hypothetical protein
MHTRRALPASLKNCRASAAAGFLLRLKKQLTPQPATVAPRKSELYPGFPRSGKQKPDYNQDEEKTAVSRLPRGVVELWRERRTVSGAELGHANC